jgi:hypothetical protein
MSEAVKYALKILRGLDKNLLKKDIFEAYGFRRELSGFIEAVDIRQGDYKVSNYSGEGLTIQYKTSPKKNVSEFSEPIKFDKEKYTEQMLELLKSCLREDRYKIEVKELADEFLEEFDDKDIEYYKNASVEELQSTIKLIENYPPSFNLFLKRKNKFLGKLHFNAFTIEPSNHPEAIYVMEKVGRDVFECEKGPLQINTDSYYHGGMKNLEEWRKELLTWK